MYACPSSGAAVEGRSLPTGTYVVTGMWFFTCFIIFFHILLPLLLSWFLFKVINEMLIMMLIIMMLVMLVVIVILWNPILFLLQIIICRVVMDVGFPPL